MSRVSIIVIIILALLVLNKAVGVSIEGSSCESEIAFQSNHDNNSEIYRFNVDTGELTNLTHNSAQDAYPAYSPDGGLLAFASDRDEDYDIYVMDANGNNIHNLTQNTEYDSWPVWSPDGTRIAFEAEHDMNRDVYVMDADGSNPYNLTNHPAFDGSPAWSADGTRIAFSSLRTGTNEIYELSLEDSSTVRQLTHDEANTYYGSRSSSGELAFASDLNAPFPEIYVSNPNGDLHRLTFNQVYDLFPMKEQSNDTHHRRPGAG